MFDFRFESTCLLNIRTFFQLKYILMHVVRFLCCLLKIISKQDKRVGKELFELGNNNKFEEELQS